MWKIDRNFSYDIIKYLNIVAWHDVGYADINSLQDVTRQKAGKLIKSWHMMVENTTLLVL